MMHASYPGYRVVSDLALARRLEQAEARNGVECAREQSRLHPDLGAAVESIAGGHAIFVGVNSMLTHAIGLGLNGPVETVEVDRLESFFRARGAPVNVELCPFAHATLVDLLGSRRYRITEFNNVLVKALAGEAPSGADPRVHRAQPHEAKTWAYTVGQGFFEREHLSPEEMEVGLTIFHGPSASCYLGQSVEGKPVAAAAMAVNDGVAILFGDSTVPAARRSGLHQALIRERVSAAVAQGCHLATASTLPGTISQRNYERMGFQVVYTRVTLVG